MTQLLDAIAFVTGFFLLPAAEQTRAFLAICELRDGTAVASGVTWPSYILRKDQPDYLRKKYGLETTTAYLAKLACLGDTGHGPGPEYVIINGQAASTPEALDVFAASRISAPRRSTSEVAKPHVSKGRRGRPRKVETAAIRADTS